MRRLADESGETVNLMVPTTSGTEAIAQEEGRHLLGVVNWVGRDIPEHASAAGKVFLAHGVADVPARLERRTDRTIVDPAALERDLDAVRARGYATLVDELEPGLSVVAAPVFDAGGGVVAALAVSGADVAAAGASPRGPRARRDRAGARRVGAARVRRCARGRPLTRLHPASGASYGRTVQTRQTFRGADMRADHTRTYLRELRMPRAERRAARAERRAEEEMRRQRDNPYSAERRAAAVEAERRRYPDGWVGGG